MQLQPINTRHSTSTRHKLSPPFFYALFFQGIKHLIALSLGPVTIHESFKERRDGAGLGIIRKDFYRASDEGWRTYLRMS